MAATDVPGIQKTPGVCGGRPCVGNHRITVDLLVRFRRLGVSDRTLWAEYYPQLTAENLAAAWEYDRRHSNEIESYIREEREET